MTLVELNLFLEEQRRQLQQFKGQPATTANGQPGMQLMGTSRVKEALRQIIAAPELNAIRPLATQLANNRVLNELDPLVPQQTFSSLDSMAKALEQRLADLHGVLATIAREEPLDGLTVMLPVELGTLTQLSDVMETLDRCLGYEVGLLVPGANTPAFVGFDVGSSWLMLRFLPQAYNVARFIITSAMRLWSLKLRFDRENLLNKQLFHQTQDYEHVVESQRKVRDALTDTLVANIKSLAPGVNLDDEQTATIRTNLTKLANLFDKGLRVREPLKLPAAERVLPPEQDVLSGKLADVPLLEVENKQDSRDEGDKRDKGIIDDTEPGDGSGGLPA